MSKLNKIGALVLQKCPRCREGDMFVYPLLKKPHAFSKMHEECPNCQANFYPEPGFYFGASYFSYALNVALMVTVLVATFVLVEEPTLVQLLSFIIIPMILLIPLTFRIARALMLHLFGGLGKRVEEHR